MRNASEKEAPRAGGGSIRPAPPAAGAPARDASPSHRKPPEAEQIVRAARAAGLSEREARAVADLERAKAPLRGRTLQVARSVRTCAGCGACCDFPFNAMKATSLEALALAVRLRSDPALAAEREEIEAAVRETVRRHGLRAREDDDRPYRCPLLAGDRSCRVHGYAEPVGCLAFSPLHRERCDMDWPAFHRAASALRALNERAFGGRFAVLPLPVALARALDRLDRLDRGDRDERKAHVRRRGRAVGRGSARDGTA